MATSVRRSFFMRFSLMAAVLVPILYFGAQAAAVPFFPGYSVAREVASVLGTADSRLPWVFNLGAILTGLAALAGALGLYCAFRSTANVVLAVLIGISLVATGAVSIRAGLFPMPDPRHGDWGFLSLFTVGSPLLYLLGLWRRQGATGIRVYLALCTFLILFLVPFLMHRVNVRALQPGTLQRLLAFASFVPIGVVGYYFARTDEKEKVGAPGQTDR